MPAPMETVELRDGTNVPIGTAANPLVVTGGGSAANPYPGADYAKDGTDGSGTGNVGTGIRGWLATIAGRLAATLQVQLAAMLPSGTNTIGGVTTVNGAQYFAELSAVSVAASGSVFGSVRDAGASPSAYSKVTGYFLSDQAGTAIIQASDAANMAGAVKIFSQSVTGGVPLQVQLPVQFRYVQAYLTNGGSAAGAVTIRTGFAN